MIVTKKALNNIVALSDNPKKDKGTLSNSESKYESTTRLMFIPTSITEIKSSGFSKNFDKILPEVDPLDFLISTASLLAVIKAISEPAKKAVKARKNNIQKMTMKNNLATQI